MAVPSAHPWCAYKHMAPDGRVLYVGKGRVSRATDLAPSRRSAYHLNAIRRHCIPALIIFVKPFATEAEAFDGERRWIAEAKAAGHKLCNFTDGGEGASGRTISPDAREKLRLAATRQWDRQGRSAPKARPEGVSACVCCGGSVAWKGRPRLVCSKRCESAHYRKPYIKRPRAPGTSGIRGVYPAAGGRWKAGVSVGGEYHHMGTFATKDEAAEAVRAAQ